MPNWQEIKEHLAASGRVEDYEVENLRRTLYAHGKVNRQGVDALAELHKLVKHRTPAFERFFAQAVRDYILEDGRVSAYEAAWLRHMLFAGGTIHDDERMLLRQLKEEAREVSPEFDALLHEVMKRPPQRTSVK